MFIGLDISFRRTGIAVIDEHWKRIELTAVPGEVGDKSFQGIIRAVEIQSDLIMHVIRKHFVKDVPDELFIVIEEPVPNSQFSSGLFALVSKVVFDIKKEVPLKGIWMLNPTYIGHLHKTRVYNKSDSVRMAGSLMNVLQQQGFNVQKGRYSHDEADALLHLLRIFVKEYRGDIVLKEELLKIASNLGSSKEKYLRFHEEEVVNGKASA